MRGDPPSEDDECWRLIEQLGALSRTGLSQLPGARKTQATAARITRRHFHRCQGLSGDDGQGQPCPVYYVMPHVESTLLFNLPGAGSPMLE